jgi:hypothetical protein
MGFFKDVVVVALTMVAVSAGVADAAVNAQFVVDVASSNVGPTARMAKKTDVARCFVTQAQVVSHTDSRKGHATPMLVASRLVVARNVAMQASVASVVAEDASRGKATAKQVASRLLVGAGVRDAFASVQVRQAVPEVVPALPVI